MTKRIRVALTGASGQLGRALQRHAPATWDISGTSSKEVELRSWPAVRDWIATVRPRLVIHAGAMTDVDGCESRIEDAYAINALGTRHVASAAARTGATLVYVSTNFVFNGTKAEPYHEFDAPNPINVYGASKLAGELEAGRAECDVYIVRTAMVYAEEGHNFVNTMRRLMAERDELTVVSDQFGNPTYAGDLAVGIISLISTCPPGTYHLTNAGAASWFEWAEAVRDIGGFATTVRPIPASEYQRAATPPANGVMTSIALQGSGVELPEWRDALRRCLT